MDFDALETPSEPAPKVFSVSDINKAIRGALEGAFRVVWLKGEISNFKAHTSGHFYFSLKDSKAQISAMMFKGSNSHLKFKPRDGMEVLVRGKITVYEPRGNYQIVAEEMEPVGAGALQAAFEQLKRKLEAEGLFDPKRKRPIPPLPKHVAVVTSPTGAAIRDILNVLGRRFAGLRVTVVPTVVQGEAAAPSICKALALALKLPDVDTIIVGRGGGSIEDMWCFNDESLARAIASSRVPIISAVGHEIDFTIADFVADLRAPTPSAAAELVTRNAAEITDKIQTLKARLWRSWEATMRMARQKVLGASQRLVDPKRRLQDLSLRCDELTLRLEQSAQRYIERRAQHVKLLLTRLPSPQQTVLRLGQEIEMLNTRLQAHWTRMLEGRRAEWARLSSLLDSLSPLKTVERGYSITRKGDELIKSSDQLKKGDKVEITFAKGKSKAQII